jgi:hypothetical protein
MVEPVEFGRREFTVAAVLAALSGVTITITACGGGGGGGSSPTAPSNPTPSLGPGDKAGSVGSNHGHIAVITAAHLTAAAAVTLDIRGEADHPHTVNLTAAEVAQIAANQRISKVSSVEVAHSHNVTFN